ncbi:hypothetical protein [Trueperella pyogenes]|uniref:hypothetical protein n=1 Tax=Trueperella pyogenes TaxID=1661 RepID=UPI000F864AB8|nr:hypothetical protein [Trueperella pyogenes]MBB3024551.1 hypothetical protein [Trueperella pyogenes]QIU86393.1 hypothetical protein HEP79_03540 [Trueperella pyogenes]
MRIRTADRAVPPVGVRLLAVRRTAEVAVGIAVIVVGHVMIGVVVVGIVMIVAVTGAMMTVVVGIAVIVVGHVMIGVMGVVVGTVRTGVMSTVVIGAMMTVVVGIAVIVVGLVMIGVMGVVVVGIVMIVAVTGAMMTVVVGIAVIVVGHVTMGVMGVVVGTVRTGVMSTVVIGEMIGVVTIATGTANASTVKRSVTVTKMHIQRPSSASRFRNPSRGMHWTQLRESSSVHLTRTMLTASRGTSSTLERCSRSIRRLPTNMHVPLTKAPLVSTSFGRRSA